MYLVLLLQVDGADIHIFVFDMKHALNQNLMKHGLAIQHVAQPIK